MKTAVGIVLVAAGEGRRLGRPKALLTLAGRSLVERAAEPFEALPDRVVVLREVDLESVELPGWTRVAGGARRRDSVAAGLRALRPETKTVLVHDVARPFLPADLLARILAAAADHAAVVPVVPLADTIKEVSADRVVATADRARLAAVQTPQAFRVELLRRALAASDEDATDDAGLVEALGECVRTVPGDPRNFKITRAADLELARLLLGEGRNPL
jgi:2-C-methyl-D-erythritol 4-phosphate cytidylyltransferase